MASNSFLRGYARGGGSYGSMMRGGADGDADASASSSGLLQNPKVRVGLVVLVLVALVVVGVLVLRKKKTPSSSSSSSGSAPSSVSSSGAPSRLRGTAGAAGAAPQRGTYEALTPEQRAQVERVRAAQALALPQRLEMGEPAERARRAGHLHGHAGSSSGSGSFARPSAFDEPLPVEKGPRGLVSGPAAHRLKGASTRGSAAVQALFSRQDDALDKKDAKLEDMFPLIDPSDKPKNGHEEVAQMYNFANFRAAHDRNSVAGWLRPVQQRQGWKRLGIRSNMKLWQETMESLRKEMEGSDVAHRFADDVFVPAEGGYLLDFMDETARSKGLAVDDYGDELGMGGRGSAMLHSHIKREAVAARGGEDAMYGSGASSRGARSY